MKWIILAALLLCVAADCLVYRRRIVRCSRGVRRFFLAWIAASYLLPVAQVLLMLLAPDNPTSLMHVAQWITFAWLLLLGCRFCYYLGWCFERRRTFSRIGILLVAACVALFVWGAVRGRRMLVVNEVEICSPRLPEAFDGFRVVQFSDLHIGTLLDPQEEIERLVGRINALRPDLVVFSGDLVNVRATELTPRMQSLLGAVEAPCGVISIIGNHDVGLYIGDTTVLSPAENTRDLIERQRRMGWRVLDDETCYLRRGGDSVSVTGISFDPALLDFRHSFRLSGYSLERPFRGVPHETFNLTVAHLPQLWPDITESGYGDLTLSGHVHSMQIKWRLFGCRFSPARLLYDRWSGRYDDESGRTLYINDGIGYVGFPMRLGAYPEITLFILKRK